MKNQIQKPTKNFAPRGHIIVAALSLLLASTGNSQQFEFSTPGRKNAKLFVANSTDEYSARKVAANECFDYFTQGRAVDDNYGTDVINICTNMKLTSEKP